jgi:endopolyphosphatase
VEYDTKTDKVYKLKDLTVRSYIKLARNMVAPKAKKDKIGSKDLGIDTDFDEDTDTEYTEDMDAENGDGADADKNKKKKRKHKKNKARSKVWRTFIRRAFVGAVDDDDLDQFEVKREECGCT